MNPDFKKLVPLACLLAAAAGLWWFSMLPMESKSIPPLPDLSQPEAAMEFVVPENLPSPLGAGDWISPVVDNLEIGPAGKPVQKGKEATVNLNGIIWDPHRPMAFINGHILSQGGQLDNIQVLRILPNKVTLLVDGKMVEKLLVEPKK